jgi:hypothetical protein
MISERSIPNIPEGAFSTQPVLTENLDDPVAIRRITLDDDSVLYSVESNRRLGRSAIDQVIRQPLNEPEMGWQELRNTLQTFGYDSRKMHRLGQKARIADHLASVRKASAQLADTLTKNQSEQVTHAVLPVLTYSQSRQLTEDQLRQTDSRKLLMRLRSFGYDIRTASHFSGLAGPYMGMSPFNQDSIEQLSPAMASFEREILNGAILGEASKEVLKILISHRQYELFDHFFTKDSWPPDDKYIAKADIPATVNVDNVMSISVGASHAMPTRDGRERKYVRFYSEQTPVFARPILAWRTYPDGTRSLRFTTGGLDYPFKGEEGVTRPSSLVGAALFAAAFGKDIDFETEASKMLLRSGLTRSQLGSVGLWVAVARHQEEIVTKADYLSKIEDEFSKD